MTGGKTRQVTKLASQEIGNDFADRSVRAAKIIIDEKHRNEIPGSAAGRVVLIEHHRL